MQQRNYYYITLPVLEKKLQHIFFYFSSTGVHCCPFQAFAGNPLVMDNSITGLDTRQGFKPKPNDRINKNQRTQKYDHRTEN